LVAAMALGQKRGGVVQMLLGKRVDFEFRHAAGRYSSLMLGLAPRLRRAVPVLASTALVASGTRHLITEARASLRSFASAFLT
jgi:hypothetical protein